VSRRKWKCAVRAHISQSKRFARGIAPKHKWDVQPS
jgi:hypothetical protein